MRRVAVTGLGIVSPIGHDAAAVTSALREARSGVTAAPEYAEMGFRCQVHASPGLDWEALVDRRAARFLGAGTAYAHIAMEQAIADAGLTEAEVSHERTGLIVGAGGPSTRAIVEAADTARAKGVKRIGPFAVPKAMCSGPSATLATWFKIRGLNYLDLLGLRDLHPLHRRRLSSRSCWASRTSSSPAAARSSTGPCRPCSTPWAPCPRASTTRPPAPAGPMTRTGTASSSPAARAWWCWRSWSAPGARGATIHGEIVGYAANSDGHDMVAPSGEGAARCMRLAMAGAGNRKIDYLNPARHRHAHRRL